MTGTGRPRGRPPKPAPTPGATRSLALPDFEPPPSTIPSPPPDRPVSAPPSRRRVSLSVKQSLGGRREPVDVDWPDEWEMPRSGDMVVTDQGSGQVTNVTYNLAERRIVIGLR